MSPGLDQWQYLLLMAGCLLVTLPLEWLFRARVYRRPVRLLQVILIVAIVFTIWDMVAVQHGLWTYSSRFTTGVMLPFDLPVEELVFFVAIPVCALLTYEAVGWVLGRLRASAMRRRSNDA